MKLRLRIMVIESFRESAEGFTVELIRFSADHGELLSKSVYISQDIVVQILALLVSENDKEKEILARYASSGDVPDVVRVMMSTLSTAIANAISSAREKLSVRIG
ncbi:MAG: hypothetical protein QXL19_09955 [Ignisphaera sp.]